MKKYLVFLILILLVGLYGCATKQMGTSQNKFNVDIVPMEPIIVYDSKDLYNAVQKVSQNKSVPIGQVSLLDIPVFNRLRKMQSMPLNRAYAIGYPNTVGGSYATWNYKDSTSAMNSALMDCLLFVRDREKHLSEKPGAQLILVNNKLLVHPDTLPTSFYVPYVMKVVEASGRSKVSHGMFQYEGPGSNLKLKLYDNNNTILGQGTYSLTLLQAAFDTGSFKMVLYPENQEIEGNFITEKIKLAHKKGSLRISKGKAKLLDGGSVSFFTGISIDHLKYYENLLD